MDGAARLCNGMLQSKNEQICSFHASCPCAAGEPYMSSVRRPQVMWFVQPCMARPAALHHPHLNRASHKPS